MGSVYIIYEESDVTGARIPVLASLSEEVAKLECVDLNSTASFEHYYYVDEVGLIDE